MAEPMDWHSLVTYLYQEEPMAVTGHYRDAIATLLCTVDSHGEDRDRDRIAIRIQEAAHVHRRRRESLPHGLASLAAHAAAIWLTSYLENRLTRTPATPSLHADVDDFVTTTWSLWGDRYPAVRLSRSTRNRAGELAEIGAYQAVRRLSACSVSNDIIAAHGALVHHVLRLALPLDTAHRHHRGGERPAHLSLSQALDEARRGPLPPRADPTGQKAPTPLEALDKALAARPAGLSSAPVSIWRGLPVVLGPGTPSDPDAYRAEILQILEAGRRLGADYTRHGGWGQIHSGLVVLAGKIAARTLHHMVAQVPSGPAGFEDLNALIDHVYPRPGQNLEPAHSDPVMAVRRVLRTRYGAALPRWQYRSIRTLSCLRNTGGSSDKNLLVHAQLCAEVSSHCRGHRNTIARIRAQIIGEQLSHKDAAV
ncbi:hypothetical protein [Streptomyces sp. NPDC092903]|uniref:hypothetical protein n=1 Tax=Streptomyces sp. NPDC092903 TaxID=3366017 RepID=UPI00380ECA6E